MQGANYRSLYSPAEQMPITLLPTHLSTLSKKKENRCPIFETSFPLERELHFYFEANEKVVSFLVCLVPLTSMAFHMISFNNRSPNAEHTMMSLMCNGVD